MQCYPEWVQLYTVKFSTNDGLDFSICRPEPLAFRRVCISRRLVTSGIFTVCHKKALYNYFISCLFLHNVILLYTLWRSADFRRFPSTFRRLPKLSERSLDRFFFLWTFLIEDCRNYEVVSIISSQNTFYFKLCNHLWLKTMPSTGNYSWMRGMYIHSNVWTPIITVL